MDSRELLKALWCDRERFVVGCHVDGKSLPSSLLVQGAGAINLPLSEDDLSKLKVVSQQAPYGLGEQTIIDTDVRKAWQVNPDLVSCPDSPDFFSSGVHELAAAGMAGMGLDSEALELDVRLYKLLLYEAGGHFKFHRDTEKEVGMFATMILQLPTSSGHTGGVLTVRQGKRSFTYDFSAKSSDKFFRTIFFCDCEHQLAEVTSGTRMCLVFSLVRNNVNFIPAENVPSFVSALPRVKALLSHWANYRHPGEGNHLADERLVKPKLLAIPLAHKYSKTSLSFAGLKGHDRVVAALVRACDFLDVHLCMLTKKKSLCMDEQDICYYINNWITSSDQPSRYNNWRRLWKVDINKEVLRVRTSVTNDEYYSDDRFDERDLFDFIEDEFKGTGRSGNEGGTDKYFYHVAVLVVWPKNKRMLPSFRDVSKSVQWFRDVYGEDFAACDESRACFQELVRKIVEDRYNLSQYSVELLEMCVDARLPDEALSVMEKWSGDLVSEDVFGNAVELFGWDACKELIMRITEKREKDFSDQIIAGEEPEMNYGLIELVKKLAGMPLRLCKRGCVDGGVELAKLLCGKMIPADGCLDDSLECLLRFCLVAGLEDEVAHLLSMASLGDLDGKTLALLMHYCPHPQCNASESVESHLQERRDAAESFEIGMREWEKFVTKIVEFLLELESLGQHELAVEFAAKVLPRNCGLKAEMAFLRDMYNCRLAYDVVLLHLLGTPEIILKKKNLDHGECIVIMQNAWRLIRLTENNAARKVFSKLCKMELAVVVDTAEVNSWIEAPCSIEGCTWEDQKWFFEVLFWFGEEDVLEAMVERVKKRMNLAKKILDKDEGLVEVAMTYGECVKKAIRKIIEARIEFLLSRPKFEEVEENFILQTKALKICNSVSASQLVAENFRLQRRVHELTMRNWNNGQDEELERLRALLKDML